MAGRYCLTQQRPLCSTATAWPARMFAQTRRVLLTDADRFPFGREELQLLEDAGVALCELPGHDPNEIADAATEASAVFVHSGRFDSALIDRLGPCKVIARCGVGYENIDVEAAQRRGILVTYVP